MTLTFDAEASQSASAPFSHDQGPPLADHHEDSTASIIVAFVLVMAATVAVLLISGTIYIPGFR